ncbi:regulatory protein RecX [Roseibium sp.]|uniref:regulatory protein RecX n=1 Tax=Roseibium sp. TaxID=1936156 RepID=UPI003A9753AF
MTKGKKYRIPTEDRLTRQAVYYLERYSSSVANLRRVLQRKIARAARANDLDESQFSQMLEDVIAKCERAGMVNDTSYAEVKVASQRRRGYSRRQITAKLRTKGVSAQVLEQIFAKDETSDEQAAVRLAQRKRIGPWRTRGDRESYRDKDMAALCRAGFSFDLARRIVTGDADDLLTDQQP